MIRWRRSSCGAALLFSTPPRASRASCAAMPAFSLLAPMAGLAWYLLAIWPLLFWRIQRLKAWFGAAGGPGSEMR